MNVVGDKEAPLLPSACVPEQKPPRGRRFRRAIAWTAFSLLAVGWLVGHGPISHMCHRHMPGWPGSGQAGAGTSQCPQVQALRPGHRTPALDAMDDFMRTGVFGNTSAARLSGAVQVATESYDDLPPVSSGDPRWDVMAELAAYLALTFPRTHTILRVEKINTYGLLFTWEGTEPALKPTVLMAHQDVVPVAPNTVSQWTHPPYSGYFDGKWVWGRGATDCKNILVGLLEAVELLVGAEFRPRRTVVLSFGFDEEISGREGAGRLSKYLLDRYGKDGVAAIVDEGAGVSKVWGTWFAIPGVSEKGYLDVEVVVRMPGGHSSVPPPHSGIGVMSELIMEVEANPYEPRLDDDNPYLALMQCGAAHAEDFPKKLRKLLPKHGKSKNGNSNNDEKKKDKKDKLAQEAAKESDQVKYLFTTSVAVDVIGGGVKANALPERTRAIVDHRVNIGEHPSDVMARMKDIAARVADKYNLTLHAFDSVADGGEEAEEPSSLTLRSTKHDLEPAPVTPTVPKADTPYGVLAGTMRALYGDDLYVAPGLMTGNTDTRYYWDLSKHIFRFMPGWDPEEDMWQGLHTVNEKASILGHVRGVQWYTMFIRNMDEADMP